jgi:hypothetical protein
MRKELTRIRSRTLTLTVALLVLFAVSQGVAYAAGVHSALRDPPPIRA